MEKLWSHIQRLGLAFIFFSLLLDGFAYAADVTYRFSENTSDVMNPRRGRYLFGKVSLLSCNANGSSANGAGYDAIRAAGYTIAYDRLVLGAQRTQDFTTAELNCYRANVLEAANHGVTLAIRHNYGSQGTADASKAQTYAHIDQLSASGWEPGSHVIAYIEGGFVGDFGEQNPGTSENWTFDPSAAGCGDVDEFYDYLLAAVPSNIYVTKRQPREQGKAACAPYNVAPTARDGSNNARLMSQDDSMIQSLYDAGTFQCPLSGVAAEKLYWDKRGDITGQVGEFDGVGGECATNTCPNNEERDCCIWGGYAGGPSCTSDISTEATRCNSAGGCIESASDCGPAKAYARKMNWVALRTDDDSQRAATWQKLKDGGCKDDIIKRLGYRFRLDTAVIDDAMDPGDPFTMELKIANEGYAAPIYDPNVEVTFTCQSGTCSPGDAFSVLTNLDTRDWPLQLDANGNKKATPTYTDIVLGGNIPNGAVDGVYKVALAMRDPSPKMRYGAGGLNTIAKEVPFNIRVANSLGCTNADYIANNPDGCLTTDSSDFEVWDSALGINYLGTTTIGTVITPPTCTINTDCNDNDVCTTDVCIQGGPTYPFTGRLAVSSDGNKNDCDDVGASAATVAMIGKTGFADKLVYYGHSDHHWDSSSGCGTGTGAAREAAMVDSTHGIATTFNAVGSPDFDVTGAPNSVDNKGVFWNCTKDGSYTGNACSAACQACVDALQFQIEASGPSDKLTIIAAGPMDIVGRALFEADCDNNTEPAYCDDVTVISHSVPNDTHSDNPGSFGETWNHSGWNWSEFQHGATNGSDTVVFNHIADQNAQLNGGRNGGPGIAVWRDGTDGWNTPTSPVPTYMQNVYDQIEQSSTGGDISDTGMAWWLLNGKPTDDTPTADQIKAVFATTNGLATCSNPNNTAACTDTLFCTATSACSGGQCVGSGNPCAVGEKCNEDTNVCDPSDVVDPSTPVPGCDFTPGSSMTLASVVVGDVNPNQILLCFAGCEEDDTDCNMDTAAVTWGTALMQKAVAASTPPDAQGWRSSVGVFFLINPTPGTNDVVVQLGAIHEGVNIIGTACYVIANAQVAPPLPPYATMVSGTAGNYFDPRSTVIAVTVPFASPGTAVVDIHSVGNPGSQAPTQAGQTEMFDINCGDASTPLGATFAGSLKIVPATTNQTMGWDYTGTLFNRDVSAIATFNAFIPNPPTTTSTTTSTTVLQPSTTTSTVEPPTTTTVVSPDLCQDATAPACVGTCSGATTCVNNGGVCQCANTLTPGQVYLCPDCVVP